MKKLILPFLFLLVAIQSQGQQQWSLTVFNNATMLPPASFAAVWNQPIHPGVSVGYEFPWKEGSKFFQRFRFGGFYHQFVQVGLQFYTETGFRPTFGQKFYAEVALGAGYLHTISTNEQAVLKNGKYEISNGVGKPHFMFGPDLSLGYILSNNKSLFLGYQVWFEAPFVPGYVPLLPNGAVHLGVKLNLNKLQTEE